MAKISAVMTVQRTVWTPKEGKDGKAKTFYKAIEEIPDKGTHYELDGFVGEEGMYEVEGNLVESEFKGQDGKVTRRQILKVTAAKGPILMGQLVMQALKAAPVVALTKAN